MSKERSNVLLFLGGESPKSFIISFEYRAIFAVDAGVELCIRWKLVPNLMIGDFDSYTLGKAQSHFPHIPYRIFDKDKDETDAELAILEAIRASYNDITLIGGFGGRIDHFLHIYGLFQKYDEISRWIGPTYQIQRVKGHITLDTLHIADKYISFIPMSNKILPTKQKSQGLKWNLDEVQLTDSFASISNEYTASHVEVEMGRGELLMIWAHGNRAQYCME